MYTHIMRLERKVGQAVSGPAGHIREFDFHAMSNGKELAEVADVHSQG